MFFLSSLTMKYGFLLIIFSQLYSKVTVYIAQSAVTIEYADSISTEKYHRTTSRVSSGCPRGVMVKAMNCGIVVREFVLQSRYYVHFRANTLGKGMNPLILPPAMGK